MALYPIAETFFSIQGEGCHAGRRAYFARLFGCNVKCRWCDSRTAWEGLPDRRMSESEIAAEAAASLAEFAVITGGEPCMHDMRPLLSALSSVNVAAHLETSGTLRIDESGDSRFDWVAVSPKLFAPPLESSLARADELKFIVSDLRELGEYENFYPAALNAKSVWIHPVWSGISDPDLLEGICEFVKSKGGKYRAGWQMHKCYFAR